MRSIHALNRRVSSQSFDVAFGQLACWAAAVLILALGFLKLAKLPLTQSELFFGVLLVLAVSLLCVNLGMLLRIDGNSRKAERE